MSKEERELIVGLDIGTSKVTCVVAEIRADGRLSVVGIASQPNIGLKRGIVTNIDATIDAISRVIQEVESTAGCTIHDVYTGITGNHIRSLNGIGQTVISNKEVTPLDVERAIEVARAMQIPADQKIILIQTQEFLIDGQGGVREPIGMSGLKLEVKVHIVTGAVSAVENVLKCVRRCGLEVSDTILQPVASSLAVLTEDEKELGVCLVDIGDGTADLAVFTQGAIRHTAVIPVAGVLITNDIAMALHTPITAAEELKIDQGVVSQSFERADEQIEIPAVGDRSPRSVSRQALANVIRPRVEEIFELVQAELIRSGYAELLSAGIVLTGASSLMEGMVDLGREMFHMPVRVGSPQYEGPLASLVCHPKYAAAMGLVVEGAAQRRRGMHDYAKRGWKQFFIRAKLWFASNF
ncbi:cell division protein FtsA [Betaproteobacteria bacterium]|nr:cell division protein FtsA [Betaproteobacteria bacterium]